MSTRSTYEFSSREDFEEAKDHIYNKLNSDYYSSDRIYFDSWNYEIQIQDDCSDPELVASICREHRGRYKSN